MPHAASKIKGSSSTKPATKHLIAMIPTLSHFQCIEHGDGLWQIDLVQHDGDSPSGEFCYTLTITEVKNLWTVHYALKNKAFSWVYRALNDACSQLPLPVSILHSDNGSEFINNAMLTWCNKQGISLTRSRGSKKNDNCFVEQKNGATVRKTVGYLRYSGDRGVAALQAFYPNYDRLYNFYYPGRKLVRKEWVGSKTRKTYDEAWKPYDCVVLCGDIPQEIKARLKALRPIPFFPFLCYN